MKYDPSNPSSAEESIFEQAEGKKLKIKSSVTFHLYIRFVEGVQWLASAALSLPWP